ncbi:MAG: Maf family protein [Bacteroidales bacterium]|nr:Maf family protein [Bacteroidales bacterium]
MFEKIKITLASGSPRRQQLMRDLGLDISVETPKGGKEVFPDSLPWDRIPEFLAQNKADGFHRPLAPDEILVTADTLVFVKDPSTGGMSALGKPRDRDDAVRMLHLLSGNTHYVLTGVVLKSGSGSARSFTDATAVTFKTLGEDEISYYIDNYKPYDKAGAYGIQEWIGHIGISSINGSYFNVMGLPLHRLYGELRNLERELSLK